MDDMQKTYMQFQMIAQHMQQIQRQLELIANQQQELVQVKDALDDLRSMKVGAPMLAPITPGIFVKATLQDTAEVTVNIGSQIAAVKSVEEAKVLIDEQAIQLEQVSDQLSRDLHMLGEQAKTMEARLGQLAEHV